MSTATAPTAAIATPSQGGADQLIEERIEEARRALWWAELVRESLRTFIVASVAVIIWVIVDQWVFSPGVSARLVACVALVAWCIWQIYWRIVPLLGSSIRPEYAARSLERDMPEMKQALTSYVTLRDQRQQPGLRSRVVRSIGSRVAGRLKTHDALPAEATGTMSWWLAAAAVFALFVGYAAFSPKNTMASVGRLIAPLASIDSPKRVAINEVLPGDAGAIAGRSIDVSATVDGLKQDELVWCRWHTASGVQESELAFDEAHHRFAGSIGLDHAAMGRVAYYIEAGDAQAGPFWLSVENVPVVALESVRYEPPAYTGEVAHTTSSGAITAVDGTKVTIRAATNRAIEMAKIEFNPRLLGQNVRATAGTKALDIDEARTGLSITFPLRSAHGRSAAVQLESYRIRVWDAAQQTNPDPIVYPIRVIADLPPEVSIVMPRKTPKNLPIDGQQVIEVHAMDPDFGLKQVNLQVRRGIDLVAEPSLWSDPVGAKGNRVSEYRFRPTEHGLRVGDVVKIAAVAIDNRLVPDDPSIEPNVARTDAIELRIVDSEQLPEQPDGNDGLSAPDDRPASDDKGDQQSQSDSASENTGESDQQSGGGSGGEGSSAKQDGDSGQGNQAGKGDDSGKSDENNQSEQGSGAGGKTEPGKDADSAEGGDPNQGDPSGQSDPNTGQDQSASDNKGQDNTGQDHTGQDNNQTPSDADSQSGPSGSESKQDPGSDASADPSKGDGSEASTPNDGSRQPNGQPGSGQTPEGGQSDAAADAPPKHDGEAFERIRDYLDKKKKEQSESDGQKGQQSKGQGEQSKEQSDQQTGDAGSEREKTDPQGAGEGNTADEQHTGSKESGDPKQESGGGEGDEPSSGDPSTAADQTGSDSGSKDPRQAANERAEGSDPQGGGSKDPQQKPSGQESPEGKQPAGSEKQPDGAGEQPDGGESGSSPTGQDHADGSESGDQTGEPGSKDSVEGSDRKTPTGDDSSPSGKEQGTEDQSKTDGTGEPSGSDQKSDDRSADRGDSKQRGSDDPDKSADSQSRGQDDAAAKDGTSKTDADSDSSTEGKPEDNTQQESSQPQPSGDPSKSSSKPPPGSQSQASGDGSGADDGDDASQPAPAPPDLEYTKKATDMVLDYLKETRDKPDSDLLDELNWSDEDLKRFADRWQKVRELDNSPLPDAETNPDVEEALRSLGMRPQASDAALQNQDKADSLRGIRDSGNRKPPPAAYRDVFEAFRRAVGRQ